MKNLLSIVGLVFMSVLIALPASADNCRSESVKETVRELKNQTHCPVMGGKIDSSAYTDIQGQRIYHCCPGCTKALTKDPDKYFKKAAAEGILFENIQTSCPVSGKEITEKKTFIDFEGRRVYFCCENCIEPFKKNAAEYFIKMDEPAVSNSDSGEHDENRTSE
jgi:YHS domain-containing protein